LIWISQRLPALQDHNSGRSQWTKNRGPWELIWSYRCATVSGARELERKLKRQHGGNGLRRLMDELSKSGS
jgi:putative endonuclease